MHDRTCTLSLLDPLYAPIHNQNPHIFFNWKNHNFQNYPKHVKNCIFIVESLLKACHPMIIIVPHEIKLVFERDQFPYPEISTHNDHFPL